MSGDRYNPDKAGEMVGSLSRCEDDSWSFWWRRGRRILGLSLDYWADSHAQTRLDIERYNAASAHFRVVYLANFQAFNQLGPHFLHAHP